MKSSGHLAWCQDNRTQRNRPGRDRGTVGDIESLPFLEAIRQMRIDVGRENSMYISRYLDASHWSTDELKTKPTQHPFES